MVALNEHFVIDKAGKRIGVYFPITEYQQILEDLEELESIRKYDAAVSHRDEAIPLGQAIDEIERARN